MPSFKLSKPMLIAFAVVAVVAGLMAAFEPWMGDDAIYTMDFSTGLPLKSGSDIIQSQVAHYMTMNGRTFVHTLLQLIVFYDIPRWLFGFMAGVIYAALVLIIYLLGGWGNRPSPARYFLLSMGAWWCLRIGLQPNLFLNYTFSAVMVMTAVGLLFKGWSSAPKWAIPLVGIFAFLAAECHEGYSIPFASAMLVFAIGRRFKLLTPVQWAVGIGFALGTCVVALAPGLVVRSARFPQGAITIDPYNLLAIFLLIAMILWTRIYDGKTWQQIWKRNSFWFVVILANVIFYISIGGNSLRVLLPMDLAALVATVRLLPPSPPPKWLVATAAAVTLPAVGLVLRNSIITNRIISDLEAQYKATGSPVFFYDAPLTPAILLKTNLIGSCGGPFVNLFGLVRKWNGFSDRPVPVVLPTALRPIYCNYQTLHSGVMEWEPKKFLVIRAVGDPPIVCSICYDICLGSMKLFSRTKTLRLDKTESDPFKGANGDFAMSKLSYPFVKNIRVRWRFLSPHRMAPYNPKKEIATADASSYN